MEEKILYYTSKLNSFFFPPWPINTFIRDLTVYPAQEDRILYALQASTHNGSYLTFFHQSRGYPRPEPKTEFQIEVWKVFDSNPSLYLYFSGIFETLHHIEVPTENDSDLLQHLSVLASLTNVKWEEYLHRLGCCSTAFFAKDPYAYVLLSKNFHTEKPYSLTDQELIKEIGYQLVYRGNYPRTVSICQGSRSEVLKIYLDKRN